MRSFLRRLKQLQVLASLKNAFRKVYPFAHFGFEGAFFLYQVRHHSEPFLRYVLRVALTRVHAHAVALSLWRYPVFLALPAPDEGHSRARHSRR